MSLSIREVRALYDVTARALRFYEEQGLLAPERDGTARLYDEQQVDRIRFIASMRDCGLSIADIRKIINRRDNPFVVLGALEARAVKAGEEIRAAQKGHQNLNQEIAHFTALTRKKGSLS